MDRQIEEKTICLSREETNNNNKKEKKHFCAQKMFRPQ
jgi:hypothetical protein